MNLSEMPAAGTATEVVRRCDFDGHARERGERAPTNVSVPSFVSRPQSAAAPTKRDQSTFLRPQSAGCLNNIREQERHRRVEWLGAQPEGVADQAPDKHPVEEADWRSDSGLGDGAFFRTPVPIPSHPKSHLWSESSRTEEAASGPPPTKREIQQAYENASMAAADASAAAEQDEALAEQRQKADAEARIAEASERVKIRAEVRKQQAKAEEAARAEEAASRLAKLEMESKAKADVEKAARLENELKSKLVRLEDELKARADAEAAAATRIALLEHELLASVRSRPTSAAPRCNPAAAARLAASCATAAAAAAAVAAEAAHMEAHEKAAAEAAHAAAEAAEKAAAAEAAEASQQPISIPAEPEKSAADRPLNRRAQVVRPAAAAANKLRKASSVVRAANAFGSASKPLGSSADSPDGKRKKKTLTVSAIQSQAGDDEGADNVHPKEEMQPAEVAARSNLLALSDAEAPGPLEPQESFTTADMEAILAEPIRPAEPERATLNAAKRTAERNAQAALKHAQRLQKAGKAVRAITACASNLRPSSASSSRS